MNKNNFLKILITLAIFVGLLIVGWFFVRNKPIEENEKQNQSQIQTQETKDWKIYRNEKFGFEMKYPWDWQVYVDENPHEDIINIYKTGKPPFTYRNNVAQISIFPEGLSTEGPVGENKEVAEDLTLAKEKTVKQYILSNNNKLLGYFIDFENTPQNWKGFIWASVEVKDQAIVCRDKTKNRNTCEPLADGLDVIGEIDESEWNTVKEILATFRFIN